MTHRAASNALLKGVNVVGMVPSSHEGVLCGGQECGCTHTLVVLLVVNNLLYALKDPH